MIIEVKNKDIFIPEYGGNDKKAEEEQIKVHHRFLLPGERKKYLYTSPLQMDKLTGKMDTNVVITQDEEGIAREIITKIENLEIKCGDKIVKVNNADKLYKTPGIPAKLIQEIEVKMLIVSPVVDVDFLEKPSV